MGTSNVVESESRSGSQVSGSRNTLADETSAILRSPKIDMRLFQIKLHYILAYGAVAGVIPYIPILGKQLGLTATASGVVYTVQPFFVLFSKPVFGALTDHVRNLKVVMVALIVTEAIAFLSILLIPPLSPVHNLLLRCDNGSAVLDLSHYNRTCFQSSNFTCRFKPDRCSENICNNACEYINFDVSNYPYRNNQTPSTETHREAGDTAKDSGSPCDCGGSSWTSISCTPTSDQCLLEEADREAKVYTTYQFWLFTFLVIVSGSCSATVFTLSDTACYELLGDKKDMYGNQRVWGTVSWGVVNILTGFLNDMSSRDQADIDYKPGFYILLSLLLLDLVVLYNFKLTKANFTPTIFKDVSRLFVSGEIVAFTIAVFLVGALTGLLWNYEFWYLQNLGASQLLLGLTVAVQCLLAEVPFFYISSYIIRSIGHFHCLVLTFIVYFMRYLLYFFLKNPWYVLPIELLHGQTYAAFYVTMTSFANNKAPPGTEATMLGFFGGVFEGLGVATGSLLSGVGFDHLGDRNTFLTASVISAVCGAAFLVVKVALKRTTNPGVADQSSA